MTSTEAQSPPSLRGLRAASVGIFALAFMFAFEAIGVLTVMPVVVDDLDALSWFGVAFAAPAASGVVAVMVSGWWCDRSGPAVPMLTGVGLFAAGLVIAGLATSIATFVLGRGVQGLGSGLAGVALYVVIARVFPEQVRPRAIAVVTSAWTLPAIVGPPLAGFAAHTVGWRWVFLAVPGLAVVAVVLLVSALRASGRGEDQNARARPPVVSALAVAAAVIGLGVAGQRGFAGWWLGLVASVVVVLVVGPRLLPMGTWRGMPGVPSAIATRGLLSAGYFGAEAYFPLSLVEHRGLGTAASGAVLTGAALGWFAGASASAHLRLFDDLRRRLVVGIAAVVVSCLTVMGSLSTWPPVAVLVLGWAIGGFGMGLATSSLSVYVLDHSELSEQGANSAALQVNDQVVIATMLALGSVIFAALLAKDPMAAYVAVVAFALVPTLGAFWTQSRIGVDRPGP